MRNGAKDLKDGATTLKDGTKDLKDGAKDLDNGAKDLKDGAKKLKDGAKDLKDGEKEFYDEGIKKLTDTFEDDFQSILDRLEAIQSDDATYTTFTGKEDSMKGNVKFIIETEGFDSDSEDK